ncbi:hypothetical protein TSUD_176060 [Trifolium subterraneum]|uniref:Uncharacterized protein n=1 Tax=Trifolium subterraneum TaxID=3900 RepID=A0A2Z6LL82_TRISU|nr:hypothetical protein TSUD_176060 [Trifolium subterraneum]
MHHTKFTLSKTRHNKLDLSHICIAFTDLPWPRTSVFVDALSGKSLSESWFDAVVDFNAFYFILRHDL